MMKPLRIGLAVNHSYAYYRGVLRGIAHYAETRPQWLFTSVFPRSSQQQRGRHEPGAGQDLNHGPGQIGAGDREPGSALLGGVTACLRPWHQTPSCQCATQQVVGDALHPRVGAMAANAVVPLQNVTRW